MSSGTGAHDPSVAEDGDTSPSYSWGGKWVPHWNGGE